MAGRPAEVGGADGRRARRAVVHDGRPIHGAGRRTCSRSSDSTSAPRSRGRALIEETRQRNAELALINSVQEALAGELEMQAIYDVVGDKIQEIFDAQVVDIAILDEPTGLLHFPYTIERGERLRRSRSR